MKFKYLLLNIIGIFVLLSIFSISVKAKDYEITNYDIEMTVNENNTYEFIENISTFFNTYKHGIYRKIPLKNEVVRLDGTKSYNRAKITDIEVNETYTTYNEGGYKVIKMGSPNHTLTGAKAYNISYTYNIGRDTGKGYDEVYINLIGSEWDTTISNITFTINMPKDFDTRKLGFSAGDKYSVNSENIFYTINGLQIKGYYDGILTPGQALTVRIELPEGYFVGASDNFDVMMILTLLVPITFLLISFIIWIIFGKDEMVISPVEFYPPEGYNSAEIGLIYKGEAETKNVVSLLIYLANKGYIKIVEVEKKSLFRTTKTFKLIRIKQYIGNNESEAVFLNGLFKNKDEVTSKDLYNKFYGTLNRILEKLNDNENKAQIFEKSSLKKRKVIIFMAIISFVLLIIKPVIEYHGVEILPFAILFPGLGFSVLTVAIISKNPLFVKIMLSIWGILFGVGQSLAIALPSLQADSMYLLTYIIGLACAIMMVVFCKLMPKRTSAANQLFGKIIGFKRFLETVKKPEIEALVMEHPTYFYDVLPFAYVLGVSDKWIKRFEEISVQAPNWYNGGSTFRVRTFGKFMNSTMLSAAGAMSSSPSSGSSGRSSGGRSSGGGRSGGGSGGGGGGSW